MEDFLPNLGTPGRNWRWGTYVPSHVSPRVERDAVGLKGELRVLRVPDRARHGGSNSDILGPRRAPSQSLSGGP